MHQVYEIDQTPTAWRYDTLEAAHRDLVRNQALFEQRNEEVRLQFQTYQKESANEILGYTTKTASLQSELETSAASSIAPVQAVVQTVLRGCFWALSTPC